ncbi:MAG: hypothetical protein HY852_24565 [Bradyrhizobium sp.]|uniref:hypothetical protein n=1 Tax=Bradyrhizobium sp. TaxID=376 RepID=UPI0025BCC358|nr:hypothetical protein [Bradyrhizobium sp.]MBI5264980.1 hypothetical protein [Bradyrhizobium sp.]
MEIDYLRRRIEDQIELIGKLICEDKKADHAMGVLDALTTRLLKEQAHLSESMRSRFSEEPSSHPRLVCNGKAVPGNAQSVASSAAIRPPGCQK